MLPLGRREHLAHISDVRISHVLDTRIMTYTAHTDGHRQLRLAIHDDAEGMDIWRVPALNKHLVGNGMLVPEYQLNGHFALYYGDRGLHVLEHLDGPVLIVSHAEQALGPQQPSRIEMRVAIRNIRDVVAERLHPIGQRKLPQQPFARSGRQRSRS